MATHQGRVKTDVPIYGVLTQPYLNKAENPDSFGNFPVEEEKKVL